MNRNRFSPLSLQKQLLLKTILSLYDNLLSYPSLFCFTVCLKAITLLLSTSFAFGLYPAEFRAYSWLCPRDYSWQELEGPYGFLGIEHSWLHGGQAPYLLYYHSAPLRKSLSKWKWCFWNLHVTLTWYVSVTTDIRWYHMLSIIYCDCFCEIRPGHSLSYSSFPLLTSNMSILVLSVAL